MKEEREALRVALTALMVKMVVRLDDGLEEIQACLESVIGAGEEMTEEGLTKPKGVLLN